MIDVTFTLPWINPKLSPNARIHYMHRAKLTKAVRATAYHLCRQAMRAAGVTFAGASRLGVRMEFVPPDRRRRDLDNAIGAAKGFRDGIADAVGIDDSRFVVSYELREGTVKGGEVRVTLWAP